MLRGLLMLMHILAAHGRAGCFFRFFARGSPRKGGYAFLAFMKGEVAHL